MCQILSRHTFNCKYLFLLCILLCASYFALIIFVKKGQLWNELQLATTFGYFKDSPQVAKEPVVLAWTLFFEMPIMGKLFSTVFPPLDENECPYKCVYTDDRNRFADEAAIIIFHIRNFNASDLPQFNPDRLNVFFLLESPVHSGSAYQNHQNYFNITMTYRRDSDIFLPNENAFTRIIPNKTTMDDIWREEDIRKIIGKKTKIALQVVSNCYTLSAREEYITELAKDLNITRYGDCTSQKLCPGQPCLYEKLEDHFFYIAFENSICRHYVTEKFWNLKRIIVPVVLSRMPFQGLDIPEDSYIAAEDFETPKALANYLLYLRNNLEEYMRYFSWIKRYRKGQGNNPLCQLCKWAVKKRKKTIKNVDEWWYPEDICANYFALSLLPK